MHSCGVAHHRVRLGLQQALGAQTLALAAGYTLIFAKTR